MREVIIWISLILWVLYGFLFIYREILRNKKNKEKNNIFHLIRFDTILFLAIYLFYKFFARNVNFSYLFLVIVITNIVYILYDLGDNYEIKKFSLNYLVYYIFYILIVVILGIVYIFTRDYLLITIILLIINILIPSYVALIYHVKYGKN